MRELTIKLFSFDELTDKAKQVAVENHLRNVDVTSDEFDFVEQDFTAILKYFGFEGIKLHWSGFCSQGDGASFSADWQFNWVDIDGLTEYLGNELDGHNSKWFDVFWRLIGAGAAVGVDTTIPICTNGRHAHHHSMRVDSSYESDDAPLFSADEFLDLCKDLAMLFYDMLDKENDWLHSDELAIEYLKHCDSEFLENGDVYE